MSYIATTPNAHPELTNAPVYGNLNDFLAAPKNTVYNASPTPTADPFFSSVYSAMATAHTGAIKDGIVLKSWAGLYSCVVSILGIEYVCSIVNSVISNITGYSECKLPVEGTKVLVYLPNPEVKYGYILGVLPFSNTVPPNQTEMERSGITNTATSEILEDFEGYKAEITEKDTFDKSIDTSSRPICFPGEYAILNLRSSGIVLSECDVRLQAGISYINLNEPSSKLEINTAEYNHIEWSGTTNHFVDYGLITNESTFTPVQGEGFGGEGRYTEGTIKDNSTEEKIDITTAVPEQTSKSRVKSFFGYLGNLFNIFISRPDRSKQFLSMADKPKDEGVLHMNVDYDGRVAVRSAAGFSLERYDRIPIPHRRKFYWDPEGNKDDIQQEEITPFEYNKEYPHSKSLELTDKIAYEFKNAYQRISEYDKDFYIPEESEDKILPKNDANLKEHIKSNASMTRAHDLEENEGRRSGVYLGDDGSVIIRDGWGSEIVMEGGTITISSASNINILPGRSLIMLAGDDLICKAFNSIDIYATKHDVRLKAERNVHICGGSDSVDDSDGDSGDDYNHDGDDKGDNDTPTKLGGVLIECLANTLVCDSGSKKDGGNGESSITAGIYFLAPNSGIVTNSKFTVQRSTQQHHIDVSGEKNEGVLKIQGDYILSNSKTQTIFASGNVIDSSELILTPEGSLLVSDGSSYVSGSNGAMIINGDKVPGMWVDIKDPFDLSQFKSIYTFFSENGDIIKPDAFNSMFFSCRKSSECGTITGIEVDNESEAFTINSPYWYTLHRLKYKGLSDLNPKSWVENYINKGAPWPGKDAYESEKLATYLTLKKAENITGGSSGTYYSKDRDKIKNSGGKLSAKTFDKYKINPGN